MTTEYRCTRCGREHADAPLRCQRCGIEFHCPSMVLSFKTMSGSAGLVHMDSEYDSTLDEWVRFACGPVEGYSRDEHAAPEVRKDG